MPQGKECAVSGQIRSYRWREDAGSHLNVTVFARGFPDEELINDVWLDGVVHRSTPLRQTPLGRRISDFLLHVPREFGRIDTIPCIAWEELAVRCGQMQPGQSVRLNGRLQSRTYVKQTQEDTRERTVLEVSVSSIEFV
jgi:single-stranded DNA-binding protein